MIAMGLVGAATGAALLWLIVLLVPTRPGTLVALGQYYAHYRGPQPLAEPDHTPGARPAGVGPGGQVRVGQWAATRLSAHGITYGSLRADLALTGQSFDALLGRKLIAAVGGFLGGLLGLSAIRLAGLSLPTFAPAVLAVIAAGVAFIAPDIDVRKQAARRRGEFREQLSVYLDLVSLKMAGHAAAAAALPEAAQRGGGWPMMLIRDTLFRARQAGQSEWDALSELGERIGVPDLRELGSLVKLVADDGAQVRATLTARAASMRRARLAEEEAGAAERDQSMRLAQILIAVGFMIFVGYPAFVNIRF